MELNQMLERDQMCSRYNTWLLHSLNLLPLAQSYAKKAVMTETKIWKHLQKSVPDILNTSGWFVNAHWCEVHAWLHLTTSQWFIIEREEQLWTTCTSMISTLNENIQCYSSSTCCACVENMFDVKTNAHPYSHIGLGSFKSSILCMRG